MISSFFYCRKVKILPCLCSVGICLYSIDTVLAQPKVSTDTSKSVPSQVNVNKQKSKKVSGSNEEEEKGKKSTRFGLLKKTRQGSFLKREKFSESSSDLRGKYQRLRDLEVIRHYSRIAQLDQIAKLARKGHRSGVFERVNNIKRKENRRFFVMMKRWHNYISQK